MNQRFSLKYDQLKQNDLTSRDNVSEQSSDANEVSYPKESNVRNICFVQLDGNRIFLNYGYLVSGEYLPEQEKIILGFTSHTVLLTGIHLEALFYDLMQHIPKQIICMAKRYNLTNTEARFIINDILIMKLV